jgi:hypothetical protein
VLRSRFRALAVGGLWLLLGLLLAGLLGLLLAAVAALQPEPAVALRAEPGVQDVARAVQLLRGHDPRRATPGRQRVALLQERDLEVMLGHGAQRWLRAASRVELRRGQARVQFSAHLPEHPATRLFGRWLNLDLQLQETGGLPAIAEVHVGRLPVPVAWAERAAWWLAERNGMAEELRVAADVVQQVRFGPQQLVVRYTWRDDSTQRVLQALLPEAEQRRLRAYSDLLVVLTTREKPAWELPLTRLLGPAFELARQRTAAGGDAAAENRAAVIVLTLYVNGRGVGAVSPAARDWPRPRPMRVLLGGRVDFPQHFLRPPVEAEQPALDGPVPHRHAAAFLQPHQRRQLHVGAQQPGRPAGVVALPVRRQRGEEVGGRPAALRSLRAPAGRSSLARPARAELPPPSPGVRALALGRDALAVGRVQHHRARGAGGGRCSASAVLNSMACATPARSALRAAKSVMRKLTSPAKTGTAGACTRARAACCSSRQAAGSGWKGSSARRRSGAAARARCRRPSAPPRWRWCRRRSRGRAAGRPRRGPASRRRPASRRPASPSAAPRPSRPPPPWHRASRA